ncbi:MAG: NUDIX domain-containing protein [Candidatus Spechtbacterales bacterium]
MFFDKSFGIIPFTKEGDEYRFLLVHQNTGHWSFPKGHPQVGETEIETAKREFREETGLNNVELIDGIQFKVRYFNKKMRYFNKKKRGWVFKTVKLFPGFLKHPQEPKLEVDEVQDYRWADFNEAINLLTYPNSKKILKKTQKYLENNFN